MINVTQTYLPDFKEYSDILKRAWDKKWVTNHGELVQDLESRLKDFLQIQNFLYCSNGTIALQLALKSLSITKQVITTPFSYVATANSILWEGCQPIFVDIDPRSLCIDAGQIEESITERTEAILATHVYGIPCDVERIAEIAARHNLRVIYDGAHAFGCKLNGRSLLSFGDVSTCSFHATKVFHTVEGGCVVASDDMVNDRLRLYRSFGHVGDDYYSIGINAKNSELHAAMGLALLPHMSFIFEGRKRVALYYDRFLSASFERPAIPSGGFEYNYAYYPIILNSESILSKVQIALREKEIGTRRYFAPSLNLLPHLTNYRRSCPVSEDISARVLCLPMYGALEESSLSTIISTVNRFA